MRSRKERSWGRAAAALAVVALTASLAVTASAAPPDVENHPLLQPIDAQNWVELPEPNSKTEAPLKSSWLRYSMAGYVYQGMGRCSRSMQLRARTLAKCAYSKHNERATSSDGFHRKGRTRASSRRIIYPSP